MSISRWSLVVGLLALGGISTLSQGQCENLNSPRSATRPYRGVVEGDGAGFIEDKPDAKPADQEVLTALDIAHGLLSGKLSPSGIGQYSIKRLNQSIAQAFETHLADQPEDWYSMREYAFVLILDKKYVDGFKELKESYLGEPTLVRIPLKRDLLGGDGQAMKKLTAELVRYARANDSADAWFVVAVLLQARGDLEHASDNLERAIAAGLDERLGSSMGEALSAASNDMKPDVKPEVMTEVKPKAQRADR